MSENLGTETDILLLFYFHDLITGTSKSGIGAAVATGLAAAKPKLLILASRNESRVTPVIEDMKSENPNVEAVFLYLDLLDNETVHAAVEKVKNLTTKIDGLINDAGIMGACLEWDLGRHPFQILYQKDQLHAIRKG